MSSKNTWIWFVVAAALFAFVFSFQRFSQPPTTESSHIFSDLHPNTITSIQVMISTNALEICAERTNYTWLLTKPIVYPAQPAAIEALLAALQKLTPITRISASELREHHDANTEYGFEPPQTSLVITDGGQRWQLQVGNKTAPGDQVFLRVVGVAGAFVADADWLKFIPHSANDWRDTALVDFNGNAPDWIVLTNGTKVIELHYNATDHLWRMTRPLVARADSSRITEALQALQTTRISQFISDDTKADLSAFGLEPADLDLWLGYGTNFTTAVHIGKSPTNDTLQVYAKREGWNAIVTTAKEPLLPWHGAVNDFRNPYLLDLSVPIAEIEVQGRNNFTLQLQGTNVWRVVGEKFPVDTGSVQQFIKTLASLRVAEFVKDVVTTPDLPGYELATPTRQITLRSTAGLPRQSDLPRRSEMETGATAGDTNAVIAQLLFGATQDKEVFVRRADEDFVYAATLEDFNRLPEAGWEFRERRIWNFSENDVAQIAIHQNGKTRQVIHNGLHKWSLAPDSQGIINPPAIEETAHRLGELTVEGWVAQDMTNATPYGFKPDNLQIIVELKNGEKNTVDFGAETAQTALAAVTLDGERWAFVFPPVLYQFVLSYLTIPANVP
jgi:hypothetical protein